MMIKRILFFVLTLITSLQVWSDQVTFTASAPTSVVSGQQFRLSYKINTNKVKNFRAPEITGFTVLTGPSTSTQSSTQIIRGSISSIVTLTYTYLLLAEKEGEFMIPGATIVADGEPLTSNSLTIKVLPPDTPNNTGQQPSTSQQGVVSNSDLFMTASINRQTVYEQEAILLTFKVYTLVNLTSLSNKMPDLKNFHTQEVELPQNKELSYEQYNGKNYRTMVWSQYVLFPQQSGTLEIPPTTFEGVVSQPIQSDDIFDNFFNVGRYVDIKKTLTTPRITINVKPLPKSMTNAYYGGVGDFSVSSSVSTTELKANEAVTLRLVVSGTGNLKLIKTPEIEFPATFDVYDPKIDNKYTLKTTGHSGNKVFEYLAIPRHAGEYLIPSIEFQYFDPRSGTYKTHKTKEIKLSVAKGEGSVTSSVSGNISKEDLKYVGEDIRFNTTPDKLIDLNNIFFGSIKFYILLIVPLILLAGFVILSRKRVADNANTARNRTRRANRMATKRLLEANRYLKENKKELFYDEVLKALWGYVGDKLVIPVSQLSKDNIETALLDKGVLPELLTVFTNLLNDCEFARYAPDDDSVRMDFIYTNSIKVISEMENSIGK